MQQATNINKIKQRTYAIALIFSSISFCWEQQEKPFGNFWGRCAAYACDKPTTEHEVYSYEAFKLL